MANAQTVLLNEDFESYTDFAYTNFGSWTGIDADLLNTWTVEPPEGPVNDFPNEGGPMAFQIINPSAGNFPAYTDFTTPDYTPHSGSKYAGDWAAEMVASGMGNNDWLISPSVTLGTSGNVLTFWVKSVFPAFGNERYKVGIYTGNGSPASGNDFTILLGTAAPGYAIAPDNWTLVSVNLDAYASQTVKIGFNCITQDAFMLAIDDVEITTSGSLATTETSKFSSGLSANPSDGKFSITGNRDVIAAEIFDLTGKTIYKGNSRNIDISSAATGNYILKIEYKDGTSESKKIIKR